ncbi:MAG: BON domain-containing protein [Acidobacteriota bacterium]
MKNLSKFIALSIAIIAFSFVSANAQNLSNGSMERQVQKKILSLPYYDVFDHIGYTVNGDTVTLFGRVRNARNKKDAEANVEDIPGVDRVFNHIEILPVGRYDEQIRQDLYRKLSSTGGLSRYLWTTNPSVRLIVDRGNISLEGFVANRGDYNAMNVIAHGVSGAFSITNNLVVDIGRAN